MDRAEHLVPPFPEDLGNRLLQVLVKTHILDVLLNLSTYGVHLHAMLKPVNDMVLQWMARFLVSMQNNTYLSHRWHVAVHQAHEPDYRLHKSAEQLDGCPELLVKDIALTGPDLSLLPGF